MSGVRGGTLRRLPSFFSPNFFIFVETALFFPNSLSLGLKRRDLARGNHWTSWTEHVVAFFNTALNTRFCGLPATLQLKTHLCTVFPKKDCAASVPISTLMCPVGDLYIPRIGPPIFLQQNISRLILGIYKSLYRHMNGEIGTEAGFELWTVWCPPP
jgi:hypothetical protein